MISCLLGTVLLLANTVLANDCSKILTISPGNITRFMSPLSTLSPDDQSSLPIYCDYFIRAPSSNYYIELNFTELRLQNEGQASTSDLPSNSKSVSLLLHQQTATDSKNKVVHPPESDVSAGADVDVDAGEVDGASAGGGGGGGGLSTSTCLPNIAVVDVTPDGHEYVQRQLCLKQNNIEMPTVFRSKSHILKIHYSWSPQQTVSFALTFVFHKWPSPCSAGQFTCDDGNCLPDTGLVCNNIPDCLDQSDERNCVVHSSPVDKQFTEVIVIVIVVVFTLGVVACVFVHYRLTTRMWRERQPDTSSTEHHHLNPHTPQSTEVAYMPGMPMDHIDQEVALQRERQLRFHAVQTDMELNLPPAIRISKDGEEGYVPSQRLLQLSWTADRRRESICPPPNKTVYQGDSPPPYRAVSKMEGKRSSSGAGGHLLANKLGCGTNSSPRISSSHCSSGDKRLHAYAGQHGSHGRLTPCMPSVQPCCHHSCHGQHGSQLPISHLSQSLHSPKLRLGASPPANTNPSTSSTMAPYAHQDSHMHGTACHGNSCHNGTGHQGPHRKPTTVAQHGYYGPPPDYTEVVPGGATINKPTTATAAQPQQQQPVQTDSQV